MVGARAAAEEEALAQRPAGTVEPRHGVVRGEAPLGRELDRAATLEVDPAQDFGALGRERSEQRHEAGAQLGGDLRRLEPGSHRSSTRSFRPSVPAQEGSQGTFCERISTRLDQRARRAAHSPRPNSASATVGTRLAAGSGPVANTDVALEDRPVPCRLEPLAGERLSQINAAVRGLGALAWAVLLGCDLPVTSAAGKEGEMTLEHARASYEALVSAGTLVPIPSSGVVAHRLAGLVDGEPVCVELVCAASSPIRVVRRTRLFSPLPPGVAIGFTLCPRREGGASVGEVRDRFAARFSVKKGEWAAFAASGIDTGTMAAVLAFLDAHGGVLTIGPDLVDWRAPGLDVRGQGEPLARDFTRVTGEVRNALWRGPLGERVRQTVDLDYLARRADEPAQSMYVSERNLAWVVAGFLAFGIVMLVGWALAGPEKERSALLISASLPLLAGAGGACLLTWHLLSVRPALLP